MEMWDCYTWDRQKLDHQHPRGVPLAQGEYHLVVEIWTVNRRGEILLTQRHPDKPYGCLWEMSGGSVLAGETSREGASRELREEVGLMCPPEIWSISERLSAAGRSLIFTALIMILMLLH